MKQLTCEMCGSTDLMKQDGVFVCQTCGCQYSVEEAKKMMVEGTVEVAGTVKVDDSAKIDNFLILAESAYESRNNEEAENYCNKIIEIDPANYKAWFLKGKAAGCQHYLCNIRIEEYVNCITKAIDNAPEEEVEDIKAEAASEFSFLSTAFMDWCCGQFAGYPSIDNEGNILNNLRLTKKCYLLMLSKCGVKPTEFYKKVTETMTDAVRYAWENKITHDYKHSEHPSEDIWQEFTNRCRSCISIITKAIDLSDDDKRAVIKRYKYLIHITTELVNSCSYIYSNGRYIRDRDLDAVDKQCRIHDIEKYHEKIKEIDPTYEVPQSPASASGGCYVATAVYGSYDCPQVWTLRRFRDFTLAETWYGRAFIRTYYAISPTLVKWFGHTEWFKRIWKGKLDRMVAKLQNNGVEDTPYKDKEW